MNVVRFDGKGIFGWPIGQDNCPLNEENVVRLPYKASRSGLTTWEIVLPRKWTRVEHYANIHRLLREAAIDALRSGVGYYLRQNEVLPEEAELIFPWEVEETTSVTSWRTLWFAYAQAWAGLRKKFDLAPEMATRLLTRSQAVAVGRQHYVTFELEHIIRRRDNTWLLMFK